MGDVLMKDKEQEVRREFARRLAFELKDFYREDLAWKVITDTILDSPECLNLIIKSGRIWVNKKEITKILKQNQDIMCCKADKPYHQAKALATAQGLLEVKDGHK